MGLEDRTLRRPPIQSRFSVVFLENSRYTSPIGMCDYWALLNSLMVEGAFGMTLRTGEAAVVHSSEGSKNLDELYPTIEELSDLLRQLTDSRSIRKLRDAGTVWFLGGFEGGIRMVGAARLEPDSKLTVEIRRMATAPRG